MTDLDASIVIASREKKELLSKTIDALRSQDFPKNKFEVIIVDDGSVRDDLRTLVKEKSGGGFNIKYLRQRPMGPAVGRNRGRREARSSIIVFIDNDCLPEKGWLREMLKPFSNNDIAFVEGLIRTDRPRRLFTNAPENLSGGKFITANMAYRKKILEDIGGSDERLVFWREDSELFFRAMERGKWVFAKKAVVYHPLREENYSIVLRPLFMQGSEWLCILKHPKKYFGHLSMDIFTNLAKSLVAYALLTISIYGLFSGLVFTVVASVLLRIAFDVSLLHRAGVELFPGRKYNFNDLKKAAIFFILNFAKDILYPLFFVAGFFDGLLRMVRR